MKIWRKHDGPFNSDLMGSSPVSSVHDEVQQTSKVSQAAQLNAEMSARNRIKFWHHSVSSRSLRAWRAPSYRAENRAPAKRCSHHTCSDYHHNLGTSFVQSSSRTDTLLPHRSCSTMFEQSILQRPKEFRVSDYRVVPYGGSKP